MEFKVGDICEWQGVRGVVVLVDSDEVLVKFRDSQCNTSFLPDGRYFKWHKEPSLKLLERPKRMVKKSATWWCNIYDDNFSMKAMCFVSKEKADEHDDTDRVACIEKTFEYEIEEE
jgi:hypothetical protein